MSCNCGSSCKCGDNCSCGKRNVDFGYLEKTTPSAETTITGVAPVKMNFEGSTVSLESGHACKCGSNCNCDPCNC